ncbi:MAG: TolC family protein [Bacteroidota bacterium]
MNRGKVSCYLILLFLHSLAFTQQLLTKQEAIQLVLAQNFDIVQAEQSALIDKNNTSILNSRYLPTLQGTGNIVFNRDNLEAQVQDTLRTLNNARSDRSTATISLNLLVFDGFNRLYLLKQNQVNYSIAQLNAKATLEVVIMELFNSYYEIARLQKTVESLETTLEVSKERLTRTSYGFDFGQNTKLDVSNAEVDVNTDSINLLNAKQLLANANRNLNFLLSRDANTAFDVDTTLEFRTIETRENFLRQVEESNTQVLLARSGIKSSEYASKITSSRFLPTLALNGDYNYVNANNNRAAFALSQTSSGFSVGATLSWNIFDGGGTYVAYQNARVNEQIQETSLEQITQQSMLNFENAWSDYQNRLFVVQAQENSLETSRQNFIRTQERYRLGQVTSLDFRTAQTNLLQAEINLVEAKYTAKMAELNIFQLAGRIQEANF